MKTITSILIVLPLFLFGQNQEKIDSIKRILPIQQDTIRLNSLFQIFNLYVRDSTELAKIYLDTLLNESTEEMPKTFLAQTDMAQGIYYYNVTDYILSEKSLLKSADLYEELKLRKPLSVNLNYLGIVQKYLGKLEKASASHLKSLKLKEELNITGFQLMASYANLGVLQWELGNLDISTEYYLKAEQICLQEGLTRPLQMMRGNLASNYQDAKEYDKALTQYKVVLAHWESVDDKRLIAKGLNSIGSLYFDLDSLKLSKDYYTKSLNISREFGEPQMVGLTTRNLGKISMKEKKYSQALDYFLEATQISQKTGTNTRNVGDYLNISEAYAALGQYKRAYENREIHFQKYDSVFKKEKIEQINELDVQYRIEKKEAEIALQQEEIKTLNKKSRADKLQKGLYAGGMTSALALSGLLVFGYRQRIKKNKIAREKQEEIYKQEIEYKKKELTSQTLHLVQKNTFIQELMDNLESIKNSPEKFKMEFRRIVMLLKKENASDKDWEVFKTYFADVHNDFDQKLKTLYADISEKEIRLAAFLRMNLTTKEIAATLNVQPDSILKSKYRLKKKLPLDKDTDLTSFLNTL
jgi:tetratricopeptide (TPR) repeat protein